MRVALIIALVAFNALATKGSELRQGEGTSLNSYPSRRRLDRASLATLY
jgi:hypothetical protein